MSDHIIARRLNRKLYHVAYIPGRAGLRNPALCNERLLTRNKPTNPMHKLGGSTPIVCLLAATASFEHVCTVIGTML